jgi:hypothetical protein
MKYTVFHYSRRFFMVDKTGFIVGEGPVSQICNRFNDVGKLRLGSEHPTARDLRQLIPVTEPLG